MVDFGNKMNALKCIFQTVSGLALWIEIKHIAITLGYFQSSDLLLHTVPSDSFYCASLPFAPKVRGAGS